MYKSELDRSQWICARLGQVLQGKASHIYWSTRRHGYCQLQFYIIPTCKNSNVVKKTRSNPFLDSKVKTKTNWKLDLANIPSGQSRYLINNAPKNPYTLRKLPINCNFNFVDDFFIFSCVFSQVLLFFYNCFFLLSVWTKNYILGTNTFSPVKKLLWMRIIYNNYTVHTLKC